MIKGIGTDIIELKKIEQHCRRNSFLKKIFTPAELSYALNKKDCAAHLATAFAAKEAIFKALGTGWGDGQELEIIRKNNGKPVVKVYGQLKKLVKSSQVMLSLSYNSHSAVAFAIIKK